MTKSIMYTVKGKREVKS